MVPAALLARLTPRNQADKVGLQGYGTTDDQPEDTRSSGYQRPCCGTGAEPSLIDDLEHPGAHLGANVVLSIHLQIIDRDACQSGDVWIVSLIGSVTLWSLPRSACHQLPLYRRVRRYGYRFTDHAGDDGRRQAAGIGGGRRAENHRPARRPGCGYLLVLVGDRRRRIAARPLVAVYPRPRPPGAVGSSKSASAKRTLEVSAGDGFVMPSNCGGLSQ